MRTTASDLADTPFKALVGLIEANELKLKFCEALLPGVPVCRDFYGARGILPTWEELVDLVFGEASDRQPSWVKWREVLLGQVDWIGGGPPCVWCSRAGKQAEGGCRGV